MIDFKYKFVESVLPPYRVPPIDFDTLFKVFFAVNTSVKLSKNVR